MCSAAHIAALDAARALEPPWVRGSKRALIPRRLHSASDDGIITFCLVGPGDPTSLVMGVPPGAVPPLHHMFAASSPHSLENPKP